MTSEILWNCTLPDFQGCLIHLYAPNFPFGICLHPGHVISVASVSPGVAITLYNVTLRNVYSLKTLISSTGESLSKATAVPHH